MAMEKYGILGTASGAGELGENSLYIKVDDHYASITRMLKGNSLFVFVLNILIGWSVRWSERHREKYSGIATWGIQQQGAEGIDQLEWRADWSKTRSPEIWKAIWHEGGESKIDSRTSLNSRRYIYMREDCRDVSEEEVGMWGDGTCSMHVRFVLRGRFETSTQTLISVQHPETLTIQDRTPDKAKKSLAKPTFFDTIQVPLLA